MIRLPAALLACIVAVGLAAPLAAQPYQYPPPAPPPPGPTYSSQELIDQGNQFFGELSQGLATVIEDAVARYGLPNGYILGQEGSGALVAGLRYGEGVLSTRNAGQSQIFWQGPTLGPDRRQRRPRHDAGL
jgi:hypothetical protein